MRKRAIQSDELTNVGSRIPRRLKNRLQRIATTEDRLYSRLVQRALEEFIDRREKGAR